MTRSPSLEDFSVLLSVPSSEAHNLEHARLQGFETGYQAGWADADASFLAQKNERGAELLREVASAQLTWGSARKGVLRALSPLISEMCAVVLPLAARTALPQLLIEAINPWAAAAVAPQISVFCAAEDLGDLQERLASNESLLVQADPQLVTGQVRLAAPDGEISIDLRAAVADMQRCIQDFFTSAEQEAILGQSLER